VAECERALSLLVSDNKDGSVAQQAMATGLSYYLRFQVP
jgi:hypothetical protein